MVSQPPSTRFSPLFNFADGIWNLGEGFSAVASVDVGGVLSSSDPTAMQLSDIESLLPPQSPPLPLEPDWQ